MASRCFPLGNFAGHLQQKVVLMKELLSARPESVLEINAGG